MVAIMMAVELDEEGFQMPDLMAEGVMATLRRPVHAAAEAAPTGGGGNVMTMATQRER